ncbi:hypothetical protein ACOSQ2_014711 [Xanthoceras sorbifolium]
MPINPYTGIGCQEPYNWCTTTSVWPSRPCGHSQSPFSSSPVFPSKNMSVAIGPGATQFAVIPVPFSSFANTFTIVWTAAFDAAYASYPSL